MDINQLTKIVKKKIENKIKVQSILIEDKTFLHENHSSHTLGKFHIKIYIKSDMIKNYSNIEKSKTIHRVLESEIKKYIHSIQLHFS
tara:strand:+ start:293 stop:553 length:261 start_codon:yes stop_codon:yes gene_type:complete